MKKSFLLLLPVILFSCQSAENSSEGTAVSFRGKTIHTVGQLPTVGVQAPDFKLTAQDMSEKTLKDYSDKYRILNIFPSLDTKVCSASVRMFNELAASLDNSVVLCISKDLPFAQERFCGAEGIENVVTLSDFRNDFGHLYGVELAEGPIKGLLSRAVVVIDPSGKVIYSEQVPDIGQEPDYDAAIASVKKS